MKRFLKNISFYLFLNQRRRAREQRLKNLPELTDLEANDIAWTGSCYPTTAQIKELTKGEEEVPYGWSPLIEDMREYEELLRSEFQEDILEQETGGS